MALAVLPGGDLCLCIFFAVHRLEETPSLSPSHSFSLSLPGLPLFVWSVNINISVSRPSSFCALCIFPSACRVVFLLKFPFLCLSQQCFCSFLLWAKGKRPGKVVHCLFFLRDLHFRFGIVANRIIEKNCTLIVAKRV